jgi:hypothetical protein
MSSPSAKIAAANIPTITALREKLNYGNTRLDRCAAFNDDVKAFRRKFRTNAGLSGASLHDWKSPIHQQALTEMTEAFLNQGNGLLYWPDDEASSNANSLRYSGDEKT